MQKMELKIITPKELIEYLRLSGHFTEQDLPKGLTWPGLIEFKTNTGENILHILAKCKIIPDVISTLTTALFPEQILALVVARNNNNETPFHLACRYVNRQLFEFIVKHVLVHQLQEIAAIQTEDCGHNAFHLLCISPYNDRIKAFRSQFEGKEKLSYETLMRYPLGHVELPDDLIIMMRRFPQVFGEGMKQLYNDVDVHCNNALMLCCYTCLPVLISCCLEACEDKSVVCEAAKSSLPGLDLSPIKLICAFASYECVDVLVRGLGEFAQQTCVAEDALSWCFRTQVPDNKRNNFRQILQCIANAYGNELEKQVLPNDKFPSILWRSLLTDGAIVEVILNKQHLSKQYELLCDLLIDQYKLKVQNNPAAQQFFLSPGVNSEQLFKSLLIKLFKINWPEIILQYLTKAMIVEYKSTQLAMHDCKNKMMNIILQKDQPNVTIPLALFYKVKLPYSAAEQQYIALFLADDAMLTELGGFYRVLKSLSNGEVLAKKFLDRIFQSQSLLKAALLQKLPFADHLDKTIHERFVKVLERCLSVPVASVKQVNIK